MLKAMTDGLKKFLLRSLRASSTDPDYLDLINRLENQGLFPFFNTVVKSGNYTVTADDNLTTFQLTGAAVITLLAPGSVPDGFAVRFYNTADNNVSFACAGLLVTDGNAAAGSVACSTSSHKIGSHLMAEKVTIGSTAKWLISNLGGTTITVS